MVTQEWECCKQRTRIDLHHPYTLLAYGFLPRCYLSLLITRDSSSSSTSFHTFSHLYHTSEYHCPAKRCSLFDVEYPKSDSYTSTTSTIVQLQMSFVSDTPLLRLSDQLILVVLISRNYLLSTYVINLTLIYHHAELEFLPTRCGIN